MRLSAPNRTENIPLGVMSAHFESVFHMNLIAEVDGEISKIKTLYFHVYRENPHFWVTIWEIFPD